jgi:tetratricopeptide (TPR) repeat protein
MDRKAKAFILKPADAFKRKSPWAFLIAQAEKALEPAEEEGEEATTDEATSEEAEPAVAGKAADWALLRRLHTRAGNMDSALEASRNEVALDDDSCAAWSRLGQTQWASGDLDGAIESFSKSADMYHAWYDLSLEKRNELKEELDGLEGDEKENFAHTVAASSCHTADGHLAAVTLASGDLLKVESIYREHLDLTLSFPCWPASLSSQPVNTRTPKSPCVKRSSAEAWPTTPAWRWPRPTVLRAIGSPLRTCSSAC